MPEVKDSANVMKVDSAVFKKFKKASLNLGKNNRVQKELNQSLIAFALTVLMKQVSDSGVLDKNSLKSVSQADIEKFMDKQIKQLEATKRAMKK